MGESAAPAAVLDRLIDHSDRKANRTEAPRRGVEPSPHHVVGLAPVVLRLDDLRLGVSVRVGSIDSRHVERLIERAEAWPPLLVRRSDNTIVDGHYRFHAAKQMGLSRIECLYFDGDETEVFIEAVRRNVDHGLPLTLADRKGAARQILGMHPEWSDRRLAGVCGLSHVTVGNLRAAHEPPSGQVYQLDTRRGRDGKARPVDPSARRRRVHDAILAHPTASLREIARMTETSHETVRTVKNAAMSGEWRVADAVTVRAVEPPPFSPAADPAFTSTDHGTAFAGWFARTDISQSCHEFVDAVPLSRVYEIEAEARRRAAAGVEFAGALVARAAASSKRSASFPPGAADGGGL
jgi:ParB-like chromosome segregation protein Spo0J